MSEGEQPVPAPDPAKIAFERELALKRLGHLYETTHAITRPVFEFSQIGFKTLAIANGGALVGMLTFVGHYPQLISSITLLWFSFATFAAGLSLTLVAILFTYISQHAYAEHSYQTAEKIYWHALGQDVSEIEKKEEALTKRGNNYRDAAIKTSVAAGIAFAGGCASGIFALLNSAGH